MNITENSAQDQNLLVSLRRATTAMGSVALIMLPNIMAVGHCQPYGKQYSANSPVRNAARAETRSKK